MYLVVKNIWLVSTLVCSLFQPITTVSHNAPRVSVSVSTSTGDLPSHSTVHHHPTPSHHHQANNHHHQNHTTVAGHQTTPQPPHAVASHPNHVINQRLNAIGQVSFLFWMLVCYNVLIIIYLLQVSQLPPLYPKPPQLHSPQLHSPQLHSPQLHSPKLHSPQINSPQLPSPQPPQLLSVTPQASSSQPHGIAGIQHHVQQSQAINPQVKTSKTTVLGTL